MKFFLLTGGASPRSFFVDTYEDDNFDTGGKSDDVVCHVPRCTRATPSPAGRSGRLANKSAIRGCRIVLTSRRDFFKLGGVKRDLNQAEDFPPLGSSASSRPAIAETTRRGNRKEIS